MVRPSKQAIVPRSILPPNRGKLHDGLRTIDLKADLFLAAEYYNISDPNGGAVYNDYAIGLVFACECVIPSRPDHPFGSKTETFPSKKAARSNSAKDAVEYLISEGHLNPDGSTKARKKAKLGAAVRIQGKDLEVKKDASYAQKVQGIRSNFNMLFNC